MEEDHLEEDCEGGDEGLDGLHEGDGNPTEGDVP